MPGDGGAPHPFPLPASGARANGWLWADGLPASEPELREKQNAAGSEDPTASPFQFRRLGFAEPAHLARAHPAGGPWGGRSPPRARIRRSLSLPGTGRRGFATPAPASGGGAHEGASPLMSPRNRRRGRRPCRPCRPCHRRQRRRRPRGSSSSDARPPEPRWSASAKRPTPRSAAPHAPPWWGR